MCSLLMLKELRVQTLRGRTCSVLVKNTPSHVSRLQGMEEALAEQERAEMVLRACLALVVEGQQVQEAQEVLVEALVEEVVLSVVALAS